MMIYPDKVENIKLKSYLLRTSVIFHVRHVPDTMETYCAESERMAAVCQGFAKSRVEIFPHQIMHSAQYKSVKQRVALKLRNSECF